MDNFSKAKTFLADLLFPEFCLGCNREGYFLCQDCRETLDIGQYDYCLCEKPLRLPPESRSGKCPACQNKKISGLYFALPYKEKTLTRKLIGQFKYQPYLKGLSATMASLIIEHLLLAGKNTDETWKDSVLVPIPLHRKKFNERGYNQSHELACELAKILKIAVLPDVLLKTKETKPQMESTKDERQQNLQNAFAIKNTGQIRDKKIFLVDDVYTTGSTMQECAKVLKSGGAKSVWGICIARDG